jgi:pimeloyl-ACP methyl ester carboxylesterase
MNNPVRRNRVLKAIDGDRSYIQTYHRDDTQDFVLFIHGILGHHRETWKDTPAQLMTEQVLAEADFGSFGYTTGWFDRKATRIHALQLITWMRAHLATYRRIYVIAHSMGGLVTREACALLARGNEDDRALLGRIKHGFFVAVPIAGSPMARWLSKLPLLGLINSKVGFLADPQVAGVELKQFYEESIRSAGPGITRPKFSLFTGTSDRLVPEPPEWSLTQDDSYAGVVEGSHGSIKMDQSANSTLLRLIVRQIEKCQSDPAIQAASFSAITALGPARDVLIVACSATKSSSNEGQHPNNGGVLSSVLDEELRHAVFKQRVFIKDLIESGRIRGDEFKEGNRRSRLQNKSLLLGPDFGGIDNAPRYLPAHRRYMGRAFQVQPHEWEKFFAVPVAQRPHILIVSGLYGMCEAEEFIQNYDCHLTDVETDSGRPLQSYWQELLTPLLISHLSHLERSGTKVRNVVSLLVEDFYSNAIDWTAISARWPVLHQHFEKASGREALDNVGVWLQKVVTQPAVLRTLQPDTFYEDPRFGDHDRVRFEPHRGTG